MTIIQYLYITYVRGQGREPNIRQTRLFLEGKTSHMFIGVEDSMPCRTCFHDVVRKLDGVEGVTGQLYICQNSFLQCNIEDADLGVI